MKDLKGSEGNPIALTKSDFEEPVIKSAHKVYIYKVGWKPINEVTSISADFRKEINIVSASLFLTVYDENGIYHPLGESSKADYFTYGRKIRVYLGLKRGLLRIRGLILKDIFAQCNTGTVLKEG